MEWQHVEAAGLQLRGVETSTSYGRPALKVKGKLIACAGRTDDHFVLMLHLERVALLVALEPQLYFQTPHYEGRPAVLVRYAAPAADDLPPLLEEAWARRVPRAWLADASPTGTRRRAGR
jgi:hypothetical protein